MGQTLFVTARRAASPSVDVELAFDTTGSMGPALARARQDAQEIVAGVRGVIPSARFAVVAFRDRGNPGGEYQTLQPLTTDSAAVTAALGKLKVVHNPTPGNLNVESYNLAFHRSFTESGLKWAASSRKIVVVMADAEGYGGGTAGLRGKPDDRSARQSHDRAVSQDRDEGPYRPVAGLGHFQLASDGNSFASEAAAQIHVTRTIQAQLNTLTRQGSVRGRVIASLGHPRTLVSASGTKISGSFRFLNAKGRRVVVKPSTFHVALRPGNAMLRMTVRVQAASASPGCRVGTAGTLTIVDRSYGKPSGKAIARAALPSACRPAGSAWPVPAGAIRPLP